MELFSSLAAISAIIVGKLIQDQHADNKSVDDVEKKLNGSELQKTNADNEKPVH